MTVGTQVTLTTTGVDSHTRSGDLPVVNTPQVHVGSFTSRLASIQRNLTALGAVGIDLRNWEFPGTSMHSPPEMFNIKQA